MGKLKKITIKPILNKNLKPVENTAGSGMLYPLYVQVTYDRKTTKIPVLDGVYLPENQILNSGYQSEKDVAFIEKMIRFEASRKVDFTVRGIGQVYQVYRQTILSALWDFINDELNKQIQDVLTVSEYHLYSRGESSKFSTWKDVLGGTLKETTRMAMECRKILAVPFAEDLNVTVADWMFTTTKRFSLERFIYEFHPNPKWFIKHLNKAVVSMIEVCYR